MNKQQISADANPSRAQDSHSLGLWRNLLRPVLLWWCLAWFLGVLTAGSVLGLVMVSGWFITMAGVAGMLAAGVSFNYLLPSVLIRTFAIGRTLARYGDLLVSHQAVFSLLQMLRVRCFYRVSMLEAAKRQRLGSALVQHRLVKDIDTLDEFPLRVLSPLLLAVFAVGLMAGLLAMYFHALLLLPLSLLPIVLCWAWRSPLAQQLGAWQEKRQLALLDKLPALTQLILWGRWQALSDDFLHTDNQVSVILATAHARKRLAVLLVQWLVLVVFLAVLIYGLGQPLNAQQLALWLAVLLGLLALPEIVMPAVAEPLALGNSLLAKKRLNELLGAPVPTAAVTLPERFSLQLSNIAAKQPGAVFGIKNVNAHIKMGRPLVVYGVSGGGKSTLLALLAGELAPVSGKITLLADAEKLPAQQVDWRSELGYLGQTVDIFNQSLGDNLRLGDPNASDEALWQVLEAVRLLSWAKQQPQGLALTLGEYGAKISGGQARRIALARLLLSPKKVLLLDEPFAGLDAQTRQALWTVLRQRQKEAILILVSHHDDIIFAQDVDRLQVGEPVALV